MKRLLLILVVMLATLGAVQAESAVSIGFSGALYSNVANLGDFFQSLQKGEGIFYGPMIEFGFDNLAVGLAANFSFYADEIIPDILSYPMMDYDVNVYLQGHLFDYKFFFDPFGEIGIGYMAKDFVRTVDDPDTSTPLLQTNYFHAGGGLNINIGSIGFYFKTLYMFKLYAATGQYVDEFGALVDYTLDEFPLKNLKMLFGAKIML